MKKLLLSVLAVALVSVAAFAQQGGKNGMPSVCEKFTWPEIEHRPRCSESMALCKPYVDFVIQHCENLVNNGSHRASTEIPPCCWNGPKPGEGGRGAKGGSKGKASKGNRGAKGGSGPNGIYYCTDPGAENMPKCTNPAQTDKKCCVPVYTKGDSKGTPKRGVKESVKTAVTTSDVTKATKK